jgi:putative flavoprotein involved in K+ transport
VRLAGDVAATTGEAGQRLRGLLRRIDAFAERTAIAPEAGHAEPIRQAQVTGGPAELDLLHAGIGTIIWATGYRRSSSFLDGVRHDAAMVVSQVLNDLRGPLASSGSAA